MARKAFVRTCRFVTAAMLLVMITCVTAWAVPAHEPPCQPAPANALPRESRALAPSAQASGGKCETLVADLSRSRQS